MRYDTVHITSLFENATEGFVVTDAKGNIILVNPSAGKMFGYAPDELINQKIEILIPSKFRKGHVKLRDNFYQDPGNRVMGHGRDLHGERKDGLTFPVEVSLSTYLQNDERYVIAFIIDITHRKEIEQNMLSQQQQLEQVSDKMRKLNADLEAKVEERTIILKEALQKLEESQDELSEALDKERQLNEIKSRFVSMASHEFRTPLSTILSSASLIGRYTSTDDQDKRTRHVDKIKGSVKHLNDLLEDFLSLGKLDEGKVVTLCDEFSLKALLTDTIDDMGGLMTDGLQIKVTYKGHDVVKSDKKLVRNVLINLLSNAIKFSGDSTNIFVDCEVNSKTFQVTVRDEGIGISEEDREHLFSSFFRGRNATNIQGTGLGLHIVKRYVDLLQGDLTLTSNLGQGTSITFEIPFNNN